MSPFGNLGAFQVTLTVPVTLVAMTTTFLGGELGAVTATNERSFDKTHGSVYYVTT